MDVGFGAGIKEPPVAMKLILPAGSRYEMTNIDGWHSVRAAGKAVLQHHDQRQAVVGRKMPVQPDEPLKPLTKKRTDEILAQFKMLLSQ